MVGGGLGEVVGLAVVLGGAALAAAREGGKAAVDDPPAVRGARGEARRLAEPRRVLLAERAHLAGERVAARRRAAAPLRRQALGARPLARRDARLVGSEPVHSDALAAVDGVEHGHRARRRVAADVGAARAVCVDEPLRAPPRRRVEARVGVDGDLIPAVASPFDRRAVDDVVVLGGPLGVRVPLLARQRDEAPHAQVGALPDVRLEPADQRLVGADHDVVRVNLGAEPPRQQRRRRADDGARAERPLRRPDAAEARARESLPLAHRGRVGEARRRLGR